MIQETLLDGGSFADWHVRCSLCQITLFTCKRNFLFIYLNISGKGRKPLTCRSSRKNQYNDIHAYNIKQYNQRIKWGLYIRRTGTPKALIFGIYSKVYFIYGISKSFIQHISERRAWSNYTVIRHGRRSGFCPANQLTVSEIVDCAVHAPDIWWEPLCCISHFLVDATLSIRFAKASTWQGTDLEGLWTWERMLFQNLHW